MLKVLFNIHIKIGFLQDLEQAKAEIRRLRKIAVDFQEQLKSIYLNFNH